LGRNELKPAADWKCHTGAMRLTSSRTSACLPVLFSRSSLVHYKKLQQVCGKKKPVAGHNSQQRYDGQKAPVKPKRVVNVLCNPNR
jgi:hypothetical protein